MSFPPEIYLIGAQKSGTTTLAYLLSQHPNICISKPKEPHFFTHNWCKGLAWYQSKFSNYEDAICIDASTTYSMAPLTLHNSPSNAKKYFQGVPQKIYSINPNSRFIYLLRDPIERTYSGHWHDFTAGREQKSFREAIKTNSYYLDVSNYHGQLTLWLEYFPIESFLFILFEDMKESPERIAKECFKFIGLDPIDTQIYLGEAKNSSIYVNVVGLQFNRLFRTLDRSGFDYFAPSYVRGLIHRLTVDNNRGRSKILDKDRAFLSEYFYEKNRNLGLLTGLSLSQWSSMVDGKNISIL